MNISFLSKHGLSTGTSILRVCQPVEYLQSKGLEASAHMVYRYVPRNADIVVLHRVIADPYTLRLIQYLKSIGCVVVYDCDDLLFDENGGEYLCRMGRRKNNVFLAFRKAMELCDIVLVSTEFLKNRATSFHSDVMVMRNALSFSFFKQAAEFYKKNKHKKKQDVVLGYLSGSPSHNDDFRIIENQLLQLLKARTSVRVLVVGHLDVSSKFELFGNRFEKREIISYEKYPAIFEEIDINLVPLDSSEDFCNGKSELKYIEAAACGIPSVCSKTHTHCRVIDHGRNGVLAGDTEWGVVLLDLIDDADKRKSIGQNARAHIEQNYSPETRSEEWGKLVENLQNRQVEKKFFYFSNPQVTMDWFYLQTKVYLRRLKRRMGKIKRFCINK